MDLLGPYNSTLQSFHYQELLTLYKTAIAQGGYAGNQTFDEVTVNTLIQQSQDFASLPTASEGQTVTDDSLNTPLDLLAARYTALQAEANSFSSLTSGLISVLEKDTALLDELLAGSALQSWIGAQPLLSGATQFSWDYGMGNGAASSEVPQIDPENGVTYSAKCPTNTYLDVEDAAEYTGLVAPGNITSIPANNLQWTWTPMTSGEQSEDTYGIGWAQLNLLEDRPLINFLPSPAVQTILPASGSVSGVFSIAGMVAGGSLPIYVRTVFTPRRNSLVITPQNAISDGSFELGGATWTLGEGWSIQTGAGAHTGSKYVSKSPMAVWNSGTAYVIGNTVRYLGHEYVAISNGTNQLPNAIGSTFWGPAGLLVSQSFPLNALSRIYLEAWLKNISADGIANIYLSCRDQNDEEIAPRVAIPGVSSATDWLEVSEVVQALNNRSVQNGRLIISLFGHTTGQWTLDDFRVHLPQNLSPYVVNQDAVSVYTLLPNSNQPLTVFFENQDFVVDDISNITIMNLQDGTPYTVRFTESFPAYQCSVNETVWSPLVMLDPNRPYPDTETSFDPIQIGLDAGGHRTLFPITDELGIPTGLTLQVVSRPQYEYYIQVTTPAQPQYGATAVLEIDLSRPTFMNGLVLTPFSGYPIRITKVETESFTTNTRQTVGIPNALIDRPMVLTFATTLLRKIFLTCYQENYNLSEYVVQPPDAIRRNTLFALQTVLPFNVRRPSRAVPIYYRGAQYTLGLEDLAGINDQAQLPGIFIAGPHNYVGAPDIIRFDASVFDLPNFDAYVCYKAFDASGVLLDSNLNGIEIVPGQCMAFPYSSSSIVSLANIASVDIFLKFVFRSADVVLERYLLQVSHA